MVSLASCRIGAVSAGGTNKGKKKIMLSYFDKKVLFLKDEKMVKTTRKIFTNGVNLSEI